MIDKGPSWKITFLLLQPGGLLEGEVENFLCITISVDSVDPNTVWCINRRTKRMTTLCVDRWKAKDAARTDNCYLWLPRHLMHV